MPGLRKLNETAIEGSEKAVLLLARKREMA
jgi:hypothetical protein